MRYATLWAMFCVLFVAGGASAASFQGLTDVNYANSVSGNGAVVVGSSLAWPPENAVFWSDSTGTVKLDQVDGTLQSNAHDASFDGSIIVGGRAGRGGFRWTQASGLVDLGSAIGVRAISNDGGVMAGTWAPSSSPWVSSVGSLGGSGAARDISANGGVVVGILHATHDVEAFRWTQATGVVSLRPAPSGGYKSEAYGASGDGSVVVGYAEKVNGHDQAFRWTEATGLVGLGPLPDGIWNAKALGVSADGKTIVGHSNQGPQRAFIWTESDGMRYLQDVLQDDFLLDMTGWTLTRANAISDDGLTIVGNASGTQAFRARLHPHGDINFDGVVDVGDLAVAGNQWGTDGTGHPMGWTADIAPLGIGDGVVDVGDLAVVGFNWSGGGGGSSLGGGATVPVPGAGVAGLALIGTVLMRRRREA